MIFTRYLPGECVIVAVFRFSYALHGDDAQYIATHDVLVLIVRPLQ